MAKVPAFYSKLASDKPVYHDNDACDEGNNIKAENKVSGNGGRRQCDTCKGLS